MHLHRNDQGEFVLTASEEETRSGIEITQNGAWWNITIPIDGHSLQRTEFFGPDDPDIMKDWRG